MLRGLWREVRAGLAALAVLTRLPVAVGLRAATTVKVAVPPAARLTRALMSSEPLAAPCESVPVYLAVQEALLTAAGTPSVSEAPVTTQRPTLSLHDALPILPPGV